MISGIYSILTIFIMMGVGFFFTKRGLFNKEIAELFTKVVIKIAIPAMALVSITTNFEKDVLIPSLKYVLVAMASMIILIVIAAIISKFLKVNREKKIIFILNFAFSNSLFIGVPVNVAILGEKSLPYVFLFFMANNITFWTLGAYVLANVNNKDKITWKSLLPSIKRTITPGLVAIMMGYLLVLMDIQLPYFLLESLRYLGNLAVPLSIMFIGVNIALIKKNDLIIDTTTIIGLIGRFIISPLVIIALLMPLGISGLIMKVFILEAGMPAQANTAIAAKYYDVEPEYASAMVGLSTILGMIVIPVYAILV